MSAFNVYLARTTTEIEIHAPSWREALYRAGRPDACIVARLGPGKFEAIFNPDAPTTIGCRARCASDAEALRWTLASVAHQVAQREAARRALAEFADGVEPGTYQPAGKRGQS
ncbi:hypothetical protein [Halomonas sp. M4R1S46]|uniref:hypothetical protein n=1 Tax=Halomonas sp. M4R1S46 TaxID=2982692 RepID=UPI0021E4F0BA|nr:hypothetical protein [Halomonas sp. M4R1S46]UYG08379.1 hypothetical protein OCT48_03290 [Halomonas sp. M4R1S46]